MIVKTSQQWFKINGKNAFGCPLRLGLYLKVECMNLSETNFSRTAESQRLWQGAICHVWTSQFNKHWRQSQKQLQKYDIRDMNSLCFLLQGPRPRWQNPNPGDQLWGGSPDWLAAARGGVCRPLWQALGSERGPTRENARLRAHQLRRPSRSHTVRGRQSQWRHQLGPSRSGHNNSIFPVPFS